ncbi:unnamed protein product [Rotaria magnacalcarata]|uniref:LIM zinc-binding domain-containing protein n=1 Tax=Rotaria magnacalcarata TaxID=392030 RepID=A0A816U7G0_9BILA|nr:unnamed protein product [Rotaria magnacalcarata]CAF2106576.1 unnamed protein product [Rotaria magnacalcarata]
MSDSNEGSSIDDTSASDDTLERLRNITKLFSGKANEEDENQQLHKVEKFAPSQKLKNTFQKFEEIGLANGQVEEEEEEDNEDETQPSNGIIRSPRKRTTPKEHIPYHEMAEVKDKFEKGLVDANKPRVEKRLDIRVQSGLTSSKKQAFEQGEFEQETESNKIKIPIETDIVAGVTSLTKQVFEQQQQQQINNETNLNKTIIIERDALNGVATEKKAQFENGQISDSPKSLKYSDEIANITGTGFAQAKLSEFLSKIDSEQQNQRSPTRQIDMDTEQGLAIARCQQFALLMNSEFKPAEKNIDVTAGLASIIKEQYIADASKSTTTKSAMLTDDIESGLAKNRAIVFQKQDETTIKRTVDFGTELLERGVAKERAAMFKNLENGASSAARGSIAGDMKLRVDENGVVVREGDKGEEIYFEKGQTRQLVEQWKTKQSSPDRDTSETQSKHETENVQQGKAKNLVQMWKTIDKENTPPPERRGPRPFTPPPPDSERRISPSDDVEINSQNSNFTDDKTNIESGYAKAVRERFLQNAEQNNTIQKRKALKQFTPPPESSDGTRRKSITPPNDGISLNEQYSTNEEVVSIKGQAKSLKNRFIALEQDALKIETAASKIKHVPKRFVSTPAPKQFNGDSNVDPTKCFGCNKTVYAMEKIEADKKVYHKSCFKCMHCKSILKLGNYTANDGQIYCKPHFLQLFTMKGNYSLGLGFNDQKTRWLRFNSPTDVSISPVATSFHQS